MTKPKPKSRGPRWTHFEPAELPKLTQEHLRKIASDANASLEEITQAAERLRVDRTYLNSIYQVNIRELEHSEEEPPIVYVSIKRRDKQPVGREHFRDFQRIKNELVGEECEGVELYPAESRLVDTANQYHMFCVRSTEFRFSFGYQERMVQDPPKTGASYKQAPFRMEKGV